MYAMNKFISNMKIKSKIKNSCKVLLLSPGKGIYDYKLTYALELGQIVSVPLRKNIYHGVVLGEGTRGFPASKLKDIIEVHSSYIISGELLNFCNWLSNWYICDISHVLKMVIPSSSFLLPIKTLSLSLATDCPFIKNILPFLSITKTKASLNSLL